MIPLFRDPHFTFRFAEDRLVPRFHLDGVAPGTHVSVFKLDPGSGAPGELLARAGCGADGWVELRSPLIVRAGGGFAVVPEGSR